MNSLNRILPLILVVSISLIMGNQLPYAYGASPDILTMEVTVHPGGPTKTVHVEDKDSNTDPTDLCDSPPTGGPCVAPLELTAMGQTFEVHAAGGDLTNETFFYLGTTSGDPPFVFTNKNAPSLHTSCSQPLIGQLGSVGGYTLKVISQQGGSGSHCPEDVVGGHGGIVSKTSLLVTGATLNASWMIPLLVSAVGIGIFVITYKKE